MSMILNVTRNHRQARKRDLSPFVQTRLYRSPEVILLEKNYDQAADIWSVGLILSELMQSSDKYLESKHSRYLSKGQSCYPISPCAKEKNTVSSSDQMIKILERFPNLDK